MTVQPPLAAEGEQPLDHEDAQDLFLVGVRVADGPPVAEKIFEMERAPKLVGALAAIAAAPGSGGKSGGCCPDGSTVIGSPDGSSGGVRSAGKSAS